MPERSVKSRNNASFRESGEEGGRHLRPTLVQLRWLRRGLDQAGGKLPLFDEAGRQVSPRTIRACIAAGWAEPWFFNPIKPDWLVCRLTDDGRAVAGVAGDAGSDAV